MKKGVTGVVVLFMFVFLAICIFGKDVSYAEASGALRSVVNTVGDVGRDWTDKLGGFVSGSVSLGELLFGWVTEFFDWIVDAVRNAFGL